MFFHSPQYIICCSNNNLYISVDSGPEIVRLKINKIYNLTVAYNLFFVFNFPFEIFINNLKYSNLIINRMLGSNKNGEIAFFVDVDTIGYFKNIKITRK